MPTKVANGSFVIPSDIVSALGEGNSQAGSQMLSKLFEVGPYGSGMTGDIRVGRRTRPRADGGHVWAVDDPAVDIVASHGEFVVAPEAVAEVGHGDLNAGHKVLHRFVLKVRKEHVAQLKKLKPPKD